MLRTLLAPSRPAPPALLCPQFAVPVSFIGRILACVLFGLRLVPLTDTIRMVLKYRTEVTISLIPLEHVRGLSDVHAKGMGCDASLLACFAAWFQ